jgi:uncharacterized membrane protein
MSDLVAVLFEDESTAFEVRASLVKMQAEYLLELEDAVVVSKDAKGKVKLHQAVNLSAVGAIGGGFWGMLFGMLLFTPLVGAAIGAGAGALSGKLTDTGISDDFMRELGQHFKPKTAALFVLVRKATLDKVLAGLAPYKGKGKLLKTSLSKDSEDKLRAVLDAVA